MLKADTLPTLDVDIGYEEMELAHEAIESVLMQMNANAALSILVPMVAIMLAREGCDMKREQFMDYVTAFEEMRDATPEQRRADLTHVRVKVQKELDEETDPKERAIIAKRLARIEQSIASQS